MSGRNGTGSRLIDRPLIDQLLGRRVDPLHVLQEFTSWCDLHGIEPGSLRRVRENLGFASHSPLAARAGFQLGIELPDPTESQGDPESVIGKLEGVESGADAFSGSPLDYEITVSMGRLFEGRRVTTAVDDAWCAQHGVALEAVERICDTCGRFPNPEAAAGTAFELAIEARVSVLAWRTAA